VSALKNDIAVAVYDWHSGVERAIQALRRAGCNMQRISIVGRDDADQQRGLGFLDAEERARIFGKLDAFWGSLPWLLLDSAAVFVPVRGFVFLLGAFAAAKLVALQNPIVSGRMSALAATMSAIGIPGTSLSRYESALKAHEFIVVVHGDERDVYRARELLETSGLVTFDHLIARAPEFASPPSLQEQPP